MMKTSLLLLVLGLTVAGLASPVMFVPFSLVFADCEANYPKLADKLLEEIRTRVRSQDDVRLQNRIEFVESIVARIRTKHIVDVRRAMNATPESKDLTVALERLNEAILESRQRFDRLLIEAATSKSLTLDEALFARIQAFWVGVDHYRSSFQRELQERRGK